MSINVNKPIQTRGGRPVKYLGWNYARNLLIVEIDYGVGVERRPEYRTADGTTLDQTYGRRLTAARVEQADDLINVPQDTVGFFNVYANGTVGGTRHATPENAQDRAKIGQLRIGILEVLFEDETAVASRYTPCTPQVRPLGAAKATFRSQTGFNTNRFTLAAGR